MKKYIFSYNNISSTIRALLTAARFKKGFHEITCLLDVLWDRQTTTQTDRHDDDAD